MPNLEFMFSLANDILFFALGAVIGYNIARENKNFKAKEESWTNTDTDTRA